MQSPVVPQLAAPLSLHCPVGSEPPAGTGEQTPTLPFTAQDRQVPVQVVPQQTPCAHTPLWQSVPVWQTAPLALRPQEPPLQYWPAAQSASLAQVDRQALRPHVNGKHEAEAGTTHEPAPSQVPPAVKVVPGIGQEAFAQEVP